MGVTGCIYALSLMGGGRQFGSVRRLSSGRYQASYWWQGARHVAPNTFAHMTHAATWLSMVEAEIARAGWVDLRVGLVTFARYRWHWLELRTDLRPRTRELYASFAQAPPVPRTRRV
ncbi:MAG: hypothetical protein ACYDD4_02865 [Acidimicrobiales bacterium]